MQILATAVVTGGLSGANLLHCTQCKTLPFQHADIMLNMLTCPDVTSIMHWLVSGAVAGVISSGQMCRVMFSMVTVVCGMAYPQFASLQTWCCLQHNE
jgi:hypothetical protein